MVWPVGVERRSISAQSSTTVSELLHDDHLSFAMSGAVVAAMIQAVKASGTIVRVGLQKFE
jgi:hypothetical protein